MRTLLLAAASIVLLGTPAVVSAQEEPPDEDAGHGGHPAPAHSPAPAEPPPTLFQSDMGLMAGTTPRDPMVGMAMPDWSTMTVGIVRLLWNRQGGPSGDEEVESSNWGMVMAQRDVGAGRLTLMAMLSAEPATVPDASPQLFQTGETLDGRPLVDRQHAHDLFMNLSVTYRQGLGEAAAWWAQAALRGEPALGPTTFMHRASAGENPTAILGHHQQDATHITDTVLTLGGGWQWLSLEASAFHGEEPDEGRWDIDPGMPDSVSVRARVRLEDGWSGQASWGFLMEPEALEEGDVRRTTASLHYGERGDRALAASFVWGRNREEHGTFDSWLLEGAWQATRRDHLYARAERVERPTNLLLTKELSGDEHGDHAHVSAVGALTAGYLRELATFRDVRWLDQLDIGLGGDVTFYDVPAELHGAYGESPVSAHVFARLRWGVPHGSGGAPHH